MISCDYNPYYIPKDAEYMAPSAENIYINIIDIQSK